MANSKTSSKRSSLAHRFLAQVQEFIQNPGQWCNRFIDRGVRVFTVGSRLEHSDDNRDVNYSGWRMIYNPVASYWGLVSSTVVLTVIGLVMVFSSSTAKLVGTNQSMWATLLRQGAFAVMGFAALGVLQLVKPAVVRKLSGLFLLVSLILQAMTFTSFGSSAGGNVGWIILGPIRFQPAEILKFALCIWLPTALIAAKKESDRIHHRFKRLIPYIRPVLYFMLALGLVVAGKDVGTAAIVALIGVAAFFIVGFPVSYMLIAGASLGVFVYLLLIRGSANRWARIQATYGGCSTREAAQSKAICFQSLHGDYALATGGLTGVGLGNSREKSYLPAQDNDYIFAIIGEELGFIGALVVILFIIVMAWSLINLSLRHQDIYMQMVLMCFGVWFAAQSFVNIFVVLGVLPVMGLPLPFISSGGSALVMCLAGAGICIRMAREQEDVRASRARG
ncbi:FtsW/RodA/SpoVE family cell cycle protein [Alloscardovia omnicolens]|uniref:FtsW/RodA/SpoVE family cell cycle protein n=1 Tax=Alloscardovia omnicolens TaxID=419015 RepID=UPI003A6B4D9D